MLTKFKELRDNPLFPQMLGTLVGVVIGVLFGGLISGEAQEEYISTIQLDTEEVTDGTDPKLSVE